MLVIKLTMVKKKVVKMIFNTGKNLKKVPFLALFGEIRWISRGKYLQIQTFSFLISQRWLGHFSNYLIEN